MAARAKMGHKTAKKDMVTQHLASLHFYQLAIPAPTSVHFGDRAAAAVR